MLALVGEGLVVECLHHDLELLFEQLAVGVAVDHGRAEGLHLAGVVAPPDAEDDPAAGEDVHHGEVLGQPDGVPHGQDVKAAAELDALGVLRQVLAHYQQVGDALVALPLEVVLGHPQDVEPQVVQEHRRLPRDVHGHGETVVVVPAVVSRNAVETDAVAFQHVTGVEHGKVFDHGDNPPNIVV